MRIITDRIGEKYNLNRFFLLRFSEHICNTALNSVISYQYSCFAKRVFIVRLDIFNSENHLTELIMKKLLRTFFFLTTKLSLKNRL